MNLILLFDEDFGEDASHVRITGRRLEHVRHVHRAQVGDDLWVGRAGGLIGRGRVIAMDGDAVELEIRLDADPPAPLPASLILALPRPPVLRRVLLAATSLGVKRIVLLNAARVEKSYWQSHALAEAAVREQLVLGLEQARDTRLPEVWLRRRFRPFVEDELPKLLENGLGLVAHPGVEGSCPRGVTQHVVLAVGPEGGWNDHELTQLCAYGMRPVDLGERILRVETAVPALLARIF
jgi:RsmE family RNA methyltransferase